MSFVASGGGGGGGADQFPNFPQQGGNGNPRTGGGGGGGGRGRGRGRGRRGPRGPKRSLVVMVDVPEHRRGRVVSATLEAVDLERHALFEGDGGFACRAVPNPGGVVPADVVATVLDNRAFAAGDGAALAALADGDRVWVLEVDGDGEELVLGRAGLVEDRAEAFERLGCEATWDLADADGWVDVLRQDTEMGAPFDGSMKRRNAHDRTEENYAILDELERMRSLSTGRLELLLEWPGTGLSAMHWEQRMNPAKFTSRTREKQYDEALDYVAVSTPYFESNEWGGLEFDGSSALLDGSFDSSSWWYAVGSFSTSIPMTQGDEYVDDAWGNRATLKGRPGDDSYFFAPTCVACDACYDADGRFLDNATVRTAPFNETCKLGEPCSVNGTTYETVKGCPDKCRGRRVRAFEAHAAHEVVVAHRYDDDANCTASASASCAGYDATNAADVSFAPVYGPGAGSFEGFFVAPVSANYTFYATFDSDLELSLSERRPAARVVLGGADAPDAADGDVFDGWTHFRGHWYKVFAHDEHDVSYDGRGHENGPDRARASSSSPRARGPAASCRTSAATARTSERRCRASTSTWARARPPTRSAASPADLVVHAQVGLLPPRRDALRAARGPRRALLARLRVPAAGARARGDGRRFDNNPARP
ncbi:hypothetical protein JL720_14102 [Aureococcus anophagefferens]|nr:hypothetical protein JL720_14102 [Aureococcus anophagefferens]